MTSELAPGSEWRRVDCCQDSTVEIDGCEISVIRAQNLLAIIDRAGLDPVRTAARALLKKFDNITRETHEPDNQVGAECFVGEHVRIDDVIEELNALEALL